MQQHIISTSFKFNNYRVIGLKKDLTDRQFVMTIFEFLTKHELLKVQILNKRFYVGIKPHWFKQILITEPILSRQQALPESRTLFE